ncbi:MAG: hypothetical protein ABEJ85_02490 [Haloarculaceae archaeon]
MRVTETRQLFEQACEYPMDHETLVERLGTVPLDAPTGESTPLGTVFERCEPETYETADDAFNTLMANLEETFIGQKYYDDRGGEAGEPHPDADQVAF